MPSRPHSEGHPRAGEDEEPEDKVTRGNFEVLAKGLFGVSREDYRKEEDRHRGRERTAKASLGGSPTKPARL